MPMTISIDDDLKRDFAEVCREIGLTPSTAIGVFAKAVVRERAIPFTLSAVSMSTRSAEAYDLGLADGIRRGRESRAAAGGTVSFGNEDAPGALGRREDQP